MLIGYDISSALPPRTGIGNYSLCLARELARLIGREDRDDRLLLWFNSLRRNLPDEDFPDGARCIRRRGRIPGPWLLSAWQALEWPPLESLIGQVDLFHAPATYIPPQRSGARVTTVHDLWFYEQPEHCDRWGGRYLAKRLRKAAGWMDAIISVSEYTARETRERLGIPSERVHVAHPGVDARFRPVALDGARRHPALAGLPETYLLSVSTMEPRKNFPGLLEAYARLLADEPGAPALVLTGLRPAAGAFSAEQTQRLSQPPLQGRVFFTGYLPDDALPALYSRATLFVMPSFCEGFGLPLLEAMACGAPVACSQGSALDESGGAAAWRFDPNDPDSIAATLLDALRDSAALHARAEEGKRHAAKFSWEQCAQKTLKVYRSVVS
ncbi:glycosyltransferase family 4 protein [Candidatus Sumerlaeota bacterium]|nr:glycosyltransferase family 4 protein [Candidatus Sumerlaeota bacterium]